MRLIDNEIALRSLRILLVEDNPADVRWVEETFREAHLRNMIAVASDGEEALEFLHRQGCHHSAFRPDLILLDLNTPRRSGIEVLGEVMADAMLRTIPLVILTASSLERRKILTTYGLRASSYLLKPLEWPMFLEAMRGFGDLYLSVVTLLNEEDEEGTPLAEKVEKTEDRYWIMANTAPVMIRMSGADGFCDFFNKQWLDFRGRMMDEELGDGWMEGLHPDDYGRCRETYLEHVQSQQEFRMEYRLRRYDSEYRWILDTAVPRFTPCGRFAGFVGSCTDVTTYKLSELALERRIEDLRRSGANGEGRMPLTLIVDSGQVVRGVLNSLKHRIEETRANIEYGEMPAVRGNVSQLEEVFHHLLSNALERTKPHQLPEIQITALRQENQWAFAIKDCGGSISPKEAEYLFLGFDGVNTSDEVQGGRGDLAICKRIIEEHGGLIWFESTPDEGTTFHFTLPPV